MPSFHVTQEKINALIEELRSWDQGEERYTIHALSRKFELDIFVVDRIARSEGVKLSRREEPAPSDHGADPNASTLDLDPDEIQDALDKPDPNPAYAERDEDTGIWRKKPTGEWERVPPGYTQDEDED